MFKKMFSPYIMGLMILLIALLRSASMPFMPCKVTSRKKITTVTESNTYLLIKCNYKTFIIIVVCVVYIFCISGQCRFTPHGVVDP